MKRIFNIKAWCYLIIFNGIYISISYLYFVFIPTKNMELNLVVSVLMIIYLLAFLIVILLFIIFDKILGVNDKKACVNKKKEKTDVLQKALNLDYWLLLTFLTGIWYALTYLNMMLGFPTNLGGLGDIIKLNAIISNVSFHFCLSWFLGRILGFLLFNGYFFIRKTYRYFKYQYQVYKNTGGK